MSTLGIRLQQARKAARLSLRDLGNIVGLSHAAIKKYEDGQVYPSSEMVIMLAKSLNVRVDFFFRPVKVSLGQIKFRKRKELNAKAEDAIAFAVLGQIERRFELESLYPTPPVPHFTLPPDFPNEIMHLEELEIASLKLRYSLQLGLAPIHDLINALEDHGVRVFIIDTPEQHFDGLSTIINDQPVIVISSGWPGDRQRFSLAHELAHYVLANRLSQHVDEEEACNRFAGSFLIPKDALIQAIGKSRLAIDWQELLLLKEQFQISMGCLSHRLIDLKIISEPYYKRLMTRFRQRGWHKKEPGLQIPSEKANAFDQLLYHALAEGYIGEQKAAELLSCTLTQLKTKRLLHANTHQ